MTASPLKVPLKRLRWQARRVSAAARWGADELQRMPVVIGNSMPKSGSHLIIQILEGLPAIGPFVNPGLPPLNRNEDNVKQAEKVILENIGRLKPGDISYCYLHAREPFISALTRPGVAPIFVYRDPRDMIVSHVFYATEMHAGHLMHRHYTETLKTMEARIDAAIAGVQEPDAPLSPITVKYGHYTGWLAQPRVLSLRFEELILERDAAIGKILDHLAVNGFTPRVSRDQAVKALSGAVQPKRSGTFRKGQPGNWREHFTPANIEHFKQQTGDLLQRLGFEKDGNW